MIALLWLLNLTPAHARPLGDASVPDGIVVQSEHTTETLLDLVAKGAGRTVPVQLVRRNTQQTETRRAPDGTIRVSWQRHTWSDAGPDGSRSRTLPVEGHTYTLTPTSTGWSVQGTVPPDEAAIAVQGGDLFGLLRELRAMLPATASPGTVVPAGSMFAGLVRDAPGTVQVSGTLRLDGTRSLDGLSCQVWALNVLLTADGPLEGQIDAHLEAQLSGTVWVEIETGWTRRLQVAGPVQLRGTGRRAGTPFTVQGGGTFASETRLEFGR